MITHMTEIWQKLLINIVSKLPKRSKRPIFFVDLADPEKRQTDEITDALSLLKQFKDHFFVVLGLNKKEAYDIAMLLELINTGDTPDQEITLKEVNLKLAKYLDIDAVVIHPVDCSACVVNENYYEESGPYVKKPKLTTGAGDNFNAGFVLGLMLGLAHDEALITGMATSGFYVRNAKSPTYEELLKFIQDWTEGIV
jgi:sugar/nucleoside kinase (ribokinase family)